MYSHENGAPAVQSAHWRALALAATFIDGEEPMASPLVLHGASRTARRELFVAVAACAAERDAPFVVTRTRAADFAAQVEAVAAAGELGRYLLTFGGTHLLLLEEMHELLGSQRAQAALAELITLHAASLRVLATSARSLIDMPEVDSTLREVLIGGSVGPIGSDPDGTQSFTGTPTPLGILRSNGDGHDEFGSFLADISEVVERQVESWRTRLREAIACWQTDGYDTSILERALSLPTAPDVDGLLGTYAAAIEHLRRLEAHVRPFGLSPSVAAVFRDPRRVGDAERLVQRALAARSVPPGPDSAMSRGAFEVGTSNELAVRMADLVATEPARRYNPLLLYGPGGVGKTHLANAIGNEWVDGSGGAAIVAMLSAESLVEEWNAASREGREAAWRDRFRAVSALIVDDVHWLSPHAGPRADFGLIVRELQEAGRQVILVSDRPLHELRSLDLGLDGAARSGMSVAIGEPDEALRERLLHRALAGRGVSAEDIQALAAPEAPSVRAVLERAVRALLAVSEGRPVLGEPQTWPQNGMDGSAESEATDRFFLDAEKVVWDWPDAIGRMIDERR